MDSIFAATAAAAMVKLSSNRAVGRNRPQIYVGFVPKATYRRKCGGNAMFKSLMLIMLIMLMLIDSYCDSMVMSIPHIFVTLDK